MIVGWLHDRGNQDGSVGGAELTMAEFAAAAPAGVEIVASTPGRPVRGQTVVVGNCVSYPADTIEFLEGRRVVRYHHDLSPFGDPELRAWLDANATHVFCSQLQRDHYPIDGDWPLISPALDLDAFRLASIGSLAAEPTPRSTAAVALGSWQNPGKGQRLLSEWADANGLLTVYGNGTLIPTGPNIDFRGPVDPADVPALLAEFATFVHLPTAVEPFGRAVVEAWAAGCRLVVNGRVGAAEWIEQRPQALESAASDFWGVVA